MRLELDGAGGDAAGKSDLLETERVLDVLTYGIECRNPRIISGILEVYARRNAIDFSPGPSLDRLSPEVVDHLRPTLIDFLKTEVRAGRIQLYQEKIPTRKRERILKSDFAPQPSTREELTFIGVEVKDQDDLPVVGTRVRFELPDGDIEVATTNSEGIARIDGLALPGNAKVSLLDFNEPGNADPVEQDEAVEPAPPGTTEPEQPEQKEFTVKVVDETGKGIAGIPMVFSGAGTTKTVPTDASGVAKWKAATDKVDVTFESAEALATVMKPIWTKCCGVARNEWVRSDDTTTTVTLFGGEVVKAVSDMSAVGTMVPKEILAPFLGIRATATKPGETPAAVATLSVQPLVIVVRMLGEHFDVDKCFLLPKALNSIKTLVRLHQVYSLTDLLIVGHADTTAQRSTISTCPSSAPAQCVPTSKMTQRAGSSGTARTRSKASDGARLKTTT